MRIIAGSSGSSPMCVLFKVFASTHSPTTFCSINSPQRMLLTLLRHGTFLVIKNCFSSGKLLLLNPLFPASHLPLLSPYFHVGHLCTSWSPARTNSWTVRTPFS
eukprot:TRINITY_DN1398_c0_g1_i13.p3 TRINITY_DN1398_c0_g1~~TRINITY_DN1398_c0_g1_i13.p3  ORF type:complete len:104 (+),score=2.80 TRINITY_DN1398_c0_g1_i13:665-976(+)